MRIGILGRDIHPPWNEAVKNMAFELAHQMVQLGHTVHLITTTNPKMVSEPGLQVHGLPSKNFWGAAVKTILRLDSENELDLLQVQNLVIHRSFAPYLGILRRRSKLPIVAYCCQLPALSFSDWARVARRDIGEAVSSKLGMLAPSQATHWTIRMISKVVASSRFIREELARAKPSREIEVVPPFFSEGRLRPFLNDPAPTKGNSRILYVGSHKVLRGEEDFLLMLAQLQDTNPELEGLVITPQPLPSRIARLVDRHHLSRTLRFLPRDIELNIPSLIQSSDLYAFTGLSPVGSIDPPLTVIESVILGTPVISYDTGGVREILGTDSLVKYPNYVALASLARGFLRERPDRRPRPELMSHYSSETAAKRFEEIYQRMV